MKLLIGLGNPGAGYALHRHNIGFMALDTLHAIHPNFTPWKNRFSGLIAEGQIDNHKILLLKPQTYMNESGNAVRKAIDFYKIELSDIIVFHDELDLAPFRVRVKKGGGAGGHNGLKSIDAHCGKDYWRVRLGIGHPGDKDDVSDYVLHNFPKADHDDLATLLAGINDNITLLLDGHDAGFMNKLAPPSPKKQPAESALIKKE